MDSQCFRVIAIYNNTRKMMMLDPSQTLSQTIQHLSKGFKVEKPSNIALWSPKFCAWIEDPTSIFAEDEIELKLQVQQHVQSQEDLGSELNENLANTLSNNDNIPEVREDPSLPRLERNLEIAVDLAEIKDKVFGGGREELSKKINTWARSLGFKLVYTHVIRYNAELGVNINRLLCSKYSGNSRKAKTETNSSDSEDHQSACEKCPFFLKFHQDNKGDNILSEFHAFHSHTLSAKIHKKITNSVKKDIETLRGKTSSIEVLKQVINEKHNSDFSYHEIYYAERKLKEKQVGKPEDDAQNLLNILLTRKHNQECALKYELTEQENELQRLLYIPKFGQKMFLKFPDLLLIDSTFKTNRFNMIMVNLLGVDEDGRNVPFGFGLLNAETDEGYIWLFEALSELLDGSFYVIISDECSSIAVGIRTKSPNSIHLLCSWHKQRNFVKNSSSLINSNQKKRLTQQEKVILAKNKQVYDMIIALPYLENTDHFETNYNIIKNYNGIGEVLKTYLEANYETRHKWAKCYIKKNFTAGTFTTSRIESFNAKVKVHVKSMGQLSELLNQFDTVCHSLERNAPKYQLTKQEKNQISALSIFKELSIIYSPFIIDKIKINTIKSLEYTVLAETDTYWIMKHITAGPENNGHKVSLINHQLACDCDDPIFLGAPCRHIISVFIKKTLGINVLQINTRWRKDLELINQELQNTSKLY